MCQWSGYFRRKRRVPSWRGGRDEQDDIKVGCQNSPKTIVLRCSRGRHCVRSTVIVAMKLGPPFSDPSESSRLACVRAWWPELPVLSKAEMKVRRRERVSGAGGEKENRVWGNGLMATWPVPIWGIFFSILTPNFSSYQFWSQIQSFVSIWSPKVYIFAPKILENFKIIPMF